MLKIKIVHKYCGCVKYIYGNTIKKAFLNNGVSAKYWNFAGAEYCDVD